MEIRARVKVTYLLSLGDEEYIFIELDPTYYFTLKQDMNPSLEQFFGNGIRLHKLRTSIGARYYNTISLVKLFIFEPVYVTLQLFPTTQITVLFVLQLSYTLWMIHIGMVQKVFTSKIVYTSALFVEVSLSLFLLVGIVFQFGGGEKRYKMSVREGLQFGAMSVMAISCVLGLVELIATMIFLLVIYIKERKISKYEEEARKLKEEDGLVEQKEGSDGAERDAIIGDKNDEPSNMNLRDNQEEPDKRPIFSTLSKGKVHPRRVKLPLLQPSLNKNNDQSDL